MLVTSDLCSVFEYVTVKAVARHEDMLAEHTSEHAAQEVPSTDCSAYNAACRGVYELGRHAPTQNHYHKFGHGRSNVGVQLVENLGSASL